MDQSDTSTESTSPREALDAVFHLRETRSEGDRMLYYGESLVPHRMLMREVWPAFREAGYEIRLADAGDQEVLVAEPIDSGRDGVPWTNIVLFVATVLSTLFVGATAWYYIPVSAIAADPLLLLRALPFTLAILGVLSVHELGHYVVGKYHGVDVSLPYLIPFILPFGTMGAVIRMRGQMPSRKALFDIGVAGPLAGLAATVVVTAIGLSLPPMTVPDRVLAAGGDVIIFHNPPLLDLIATVLNQPTSYGGAAPADQRIVNPIRQAILALLGEPPVASAPGKTVSPVVIGGWVGMFFTVLNLLPVGQLDGGHILRAMVGERQETIAALVPLALFGLAAYLYYDVGLGLNDSVGLWAFWGMFATFIAYTGSATPVDETPLDRRRMALGAFTFALGLLCFLAVPVQLVSA